MTEGQNTPAKTGRSTQIGPYALGFIVFLAPILVVALARLVFNNIIEVGRIEMTFLLGASFGGRGCAHTGPAGGGTIR